MRLASFFLPPPARSTATLHPLLLFVIVIGVVVDARRGALVRDGMNSKSAWDNPLLVGRGDVATDPDVVAIASKCSRWTIDPILLDSSVEEKTSSDARNEAMTSSTEVREMLGRLTTRPIHLIFRSRTLANNARRSNWLRTTASLGGGGGGSAEKFTGMPLRAVWTIGSSAPSAAAAVSTSVLDDDYETCLGRLYGKCVEIEVLLPKTDIGNNFIRRLVLGRRGGGRSSSNNGKVEAGRPPPSVVYRVPIQSGHVNPMGMTSKCRALVTLYPRGRTVSSASSSSSATGGGSSSSNNSNDDVVINLGLTNIHLPLGPGLVDPSWSKGRKVFWKGRSVGLV